MDVKIILNIHLKQDKQTYSNRFFNAMSAILSFKCIEISVMYTETKLYEKGLWVLKRACNDNN